MRKLFFLVMVVVSSVQLQAIDLNHKSNNTPNLGSGNISKPILNCKPINSSSLQPSPLSNNNKILASKIYQRPSSLSYNSNAQPNRDAVQNSFTAIQKNNNKPIPKYTSDISTRTNLKIPDRTFVAKDKDLEDYAKKRLRADFQSDSTYDNSKDSIFGSRNSNSSLGESDCSLRNNTKGRNVQDNNYPNRFDSGNNNSSNVSFDVHKNRYDKTTAIKPFKKIPDFTAVAQSRKEVTQALHKAVIVQEIIKKKIIASQSESTLLQDASKQKTNNFIEVLGTSTSFFSSLDSDTKEKIIKQSAVKNLQLTPVHGQEEIFKKDKKVLSTLIQTTVAQENITRRYQYEKLQEDNLKKEQEIKQKQIVIAHEILQKRNFQRAARKAAIEDQTMFVDEDERFRQIMDFSRNVDRENIVDIVGLKKRMYAAIESVNIGVASCDAYNPDFTITHSLYQQEERRQQLITVSIELVSRSQQQRALPGNYDYVQLFRANLNMYYRMSLDRTNIHTARTDYEIQECFREAEIQAIIKTINAWPAILQEVADRQAEKDRIAAEKALQPGLGTRIANRLCFWKKSNDVASVNQPIAVTPQSIVQQPLVENLVNASPVIAPLSEDQSIDVSTVEDQIVKDSFELENQDQLIDVVKPIDPIADKTQPSEDEAISPASSDKEQEVISPTPDDEDQNKPEVKKNRAPETYQPQPVAVKDPKDDFLPLDHLKHDEKTDISDWSKSKNKSSTGNLSSMPEEMADQLHDGFMLVHNENFGPMSEKELAMIDFMLNSMVHAQNNMTVELAQTGLQAWNNAQQAQTDEEYAHCIQKSQACYNMMRNNSPTQSIGQHVKLVNSDGIDYLMEQYQTQIQAIKRAKASNAQPDIALYYNQCEQRFENRQQALVTTKEQIRTNDFTNYEYKMSSDAREFMMLHNLNYAAFDPMKSTAFQDCLAKENLDIIEASVRIAAQSGFAPEIKEFTQQRCNLAVAAQQLNQLSKIEESAAVTNINHVLTPIEQEMYELQLEREAWKSLGRGVYKGTARALKKWDDFFKRLGHEPGKTIGEMGQSCKAIGNCLVSGLVEIGQFNPAIYADDAIRDLIDNFKKETNFDETKPSRVQLRNERNLQSLENGVVHTINTAQNIIINMIEKSLEDNIADFTELTVDMLITNKVADSLINVSKFVGSSLIEAGCEIAEVIPPHLLNSTVEYTMNGAGELITIADTTGESIGAAVAAAGKELLDPFEKGIHLAAQSNNLARKGGGEKAINEAFEQSIFDNSEASSPNAQANLDKKLRALEKAQDVSDKVKVLPDGRIRYYTKEAPSKTPGPTRGSSYVTEYNPGTGQVRAWQECYDQAGNVNRVHPKSLDGQDLIGQHYPPTKLELESFQKYE